MCTDCARASRRLNRRIEPFVTDGIIAVCVVLFLAGLFTHLVYRYLAFNPVVGYFQPWRLLTTAFLHGGWMHLIFNMFTLYIVGRPIEKAVGPMRFAGIYLLSALGSSLAVLAWCFIDPSTYQTVTVGASGAVFGLFAAFFILQRRDGGDTRSIVALIAANLVYGFIVPGISWQGHVGGLVTGLAVTFVFERLTAYRRRKGGRPTALGGVLAFCVMGLVIIGLIVACYVALAR